MTISVITGAELYTPTHQGIADIAIAGGKIVAIGDCSQWCRLPTANVIDGRGCIVTPGLVDALAHISGGGGEGGFHTRTPQMPFCDAVRAGVTTLVAALGTDAITRTLEDMLAKAKAFKHLGLSVFAYTGNYHLPAVTITGSVSKDIMLVEEFIGVGEIAIADHRSSQPTAQQLAELASQARVGGMLSNKSGIVFVHVGARPQRLDLLLRITEQTDIPITQFYPTHINRDQGLLDAGVEWAKRGGFIDMTASTNQHFIAEGEIAAAKAVAYTLAKGVAATQVSVSSDGNASLPVFDQHGNLIGVEVGKVQSLYDCLIEMIRDYHVSVEDALRAVSTTPAAVLKLQKGNLHVDADADVLVIDPTDWALQHVFARGKHLLNYGQMTVHAPFEVDHF